MSVRRTSILSCSSPPLAGLGARGWPASSTAAAPSRSAATHASARVVGQPPAQLHDPGEQLLQLPQPRQVAERWRSATRCWRPSTAPGAARDSANGPAGAGQRHHPHRPPGRSRTGRSRVRSVAARARGVSVQVVAARSRNKTFPQWRFLQRKFGTRLARPGQPATVNQVSFARDCRGACRGRGGTPHAKYFMFNNVGPSPREGHRHPDLDEPHPARLQRPVEPGRGQPRPQRLQRLHDDLRQTRLGCPAAGPAPGPHALHGQLVPHRRVLPLPRQRAHRSGDAACSAASRAPNAGQAVRPATAPGSASSTTRSTATAVSGSPSVCASLWNAGCDIKMIYSVSSRPGRSRSCATARAVAASR